MQLKVRAILVLALLAGLLSLFLRNVDLSLVWTHIVSADPGWLTFSVATMLLNLALRARRWQFLLEPLGQTTFANAFRATTVGFAASGLLPARAGEVIRPYFLSRYERMSATGAFATVILERFLDLLVVQLLLAAFVFVFPGDVESRNPSLFTAVKWGGAAAAVGSLAGLGMLFLVAKNPERLRKGLQRLEGVSPKSFAGTVGRIVERFTQGLGTIRRPSRLFLALVWSFPLWLSIDAGIWSAAVAFGLNVPFTGSFVIVPILTLGVAVPTPGYIGGFHEAFRLSATAFYGVSNDRAVAAAIVLHALSFGPAVILGLVFAAQAGLNLGGLRRLAEHPQEGQANV